LAVSPIATAKFSQAADFGKRLYSAIVLIMHRLHEDDLAGHAGEEYPELRRAVREQCEAFEANVVLIEDKASGTQRIQELVEQGLHAVTRYQPQSDKIMRMHAQTAMIENGFVHLPKEAAWLAEYLHELTVFPNGKHDDQVDSTAQMLDWFKRAGSGPTTDAGIWLLYKQRYEAQQAGLQTPRREPLSVMARRLGLLRSL
jgi:predicted phage terminase large subunit-like protein